MELLYLWVDNYQDGFLDKQGINFDNRFQYQIKQKKNEDYELHIKENYNFLEDFFQPKDKSSEEMAKIKNITAIVGQNGVGKSRVIDFLKENFGTNSVADNDEQIKNYLYITREYRDNGIVHYINFPKKMNVDIDLYKGINYKYQIRNDQGIPCSLKKTTLIYFSNVYDNKEEYSVGNMMNISTNHLSNNFNRFPEKYIESEGSKFKFQEIKRQIQFIYAMKNKFKNLKLPFDVPEQIDLFYHGRSNSLASQRQVILGEEKNILESIQKFYNSISVAKKNEFHVPFSPMQRNFVIGFTRCILGHLYRELRNEAWGHIIENIEFTIPQKGSFKDNYDRLRKGILEFALLLENRDEKLNKLIKMLISLEQLMGKFYDQYLYQTERMENGIKYKFSFNIKEESGNDFEEFLELYENACITNDFIDFSWRNLSSGERALLNIYARFYFASKRKELTENTENDLMILIDEGEVYLHPHWQGKLLNILIEYFPIVFRNIGGEKQRNIQIILTSNSPFVVSDLPSTNIIFLKKEMEKSVVVDSLEEYHQTFAANIHSLLAHSFFMEDGVTGAFAKRKINEIIQLLIKEDTDTIFQNEEKITRTINLIGEPVIRNKLSQMLTDRQSISMLNVNSEIQKLRLRIEKLEKMKNDTNQA
ncbi:AAA family ATPase [Bacillus bombysepticus]